MSVAGFVLAVVIALCVLAAVLWPLFRERYKVDAPDELADRRRRLNAYYERVLAIIRDIDEDMALGKGDRQTAADERAVWVERGMRALRMLDEIDEADAVLNPSDWDSFTEQEHRLDDRDDLDDITGERAASLDIDATTDTSVTGSIHDTGLAEPSDEPSAEAASHTANREVQTS